MEELGCSTLNFLSGREAEKLNNHGPMKKIFDKTGLDRNGPWNSRFLHLIGRYQWIGVWWVRFKRMTAAENLLARAYAKDLFGRGW